MGGDISHLSRPNLRPTQFHTTRVLGFVLGFKPPGGGVDHLLPSSAEIIRKDRGYLCVLECPRGMLGSTLLLYFTLLHIRKELTPWKGLFIEKPAVPYLVKKSPCFTETETSQPCSQKPSSKPHVLIPRLPILFLQDVV